MRVSIGYVLVGGQRLTMMTSAVYGFSDVLLVNAYMIDLFHKVQGEDRITKQFDGQLQQTEALRVRSLSEVCPIDRPPLTSCTVWLELFILSVLAGTVLGGPL